MDTELDLLSGRARAKAKMAGNFQYFGVSGNFRAIRAYYGRVLSIPLKWLNRRAVRGKSTSTVL